MQRRPSFFHRSLLCHLGRTLPRTRPQGRRNGFAGAVPLFIQGGLEPRFPLLRDIIHRRRSSHCHIPIRQRDGHPNCNTLQTNAGCPKTLHIRPVKRQQQNSTPYGIRQNIHFSLFMERTGRAGSAGGTITQPTLLHVFSHS